MVKKFLALLCLIPLAIVYMIVSRHIPVDMAGFAIHVNLFVKKPQVKVGFRPGLNRRSKRGFMESDLIKSIGGSREQIECRGVANEVCRHIYVYHYVPCVVSIIAWCLPLY